MTITKDEVVYKLRPNIKFTEARTEESLEDPVVPEPPPSAPVPEPRRATTPQPRHEVGPSREQHWKDIDLSNFELLETPFLQVRAELTHLRDHYWKHEHIIRGVSRVLGNSGPGNILREVVRVTDRSKMDALETKKAQLAA